MNESEIQAILAERDALAASEARLRAALAPLRRLVADYLIESEDRTPADILRVVAEADAALAAAPGPAAGEGE